MSAAPRTVRRLGARAACLLVVLCAGSALVAAEPAARRPNILFALADDWAWPHAAAYGDKVVGTPTFDRLVREGVVFDFACVSSPSCTPSRNAILTGQQFYRLGEGANLWGTLDVHYPNFVTLLRESGYQTAHWRKAWGPGDFHPGGYDEDPCGPESRFDEFMKHRDPSKPFCFWFGTVDPHRPYEAGRGRASGIDVDAIHVPGFLPDTDVVRSDIADYYYEVERFDREVGEAIALLEKSGELDNTIIVMTGDNGIPFPRCKGNLYDWGVREPLAIRWGDRVKPGRRVSEFVSFTDFAPTFLAAASVPIPESMTGRSLLGVLTGLDGGNPASVPDFIVFGRERHAVAQAMPSMDGYPSRAIRTKRWLLILNLEPERWPAGVPSGSTHPMDMFADCDDGPTKRLIATGRDVPEMHGYYELCFAKRGEVELYDCVADPDQLVNLAADPKYADTVGMLRKKLVDYLVATGDPRLTDGPARFDEYPYYGGYLPAYLKQHGYPPNH